MGRLAMHAIQCGVLLCWLPGTGCSLLLDPDEYVADPANQADAALEGSVPDGGVPDAQTDGQLPDREAPDVGPPDTSLPDANPEAGPCRELPRPGMPSCCFSDSDCVAGEACIGATGCGAGLEGLCLMRPPGPMQCLGDEHCERGRRCMGAQVCSCGAPCAMPTPGMCR
ncbi:MAG: hypothetical protein AAGF12_35980 [Myxococcota bacterium]